MQSSWNNSANGWFRTSMMTRARRKAFDVASVVAALAAIAFLALLLVVPARAQEATIRVGHFPNITHVQALVARNFERQGKSWYAERLGQGVKIEWYVYNAGPTAMEAIFARALDITYVGPNPALNAYTRSRGEEIRVVAGAVNGGAALIVQRGSGLKAPADFRGKKVATPQFGNTQDIAARAWFGNAGLRVTQTGGDVHILPTQNPDQLSLFTQKQIDAVWTVEPWVTRLELEASGEVLLEEKDAITTILVSSVNFMKERRELLRKFVAAHRELTEWIKANPEAAQRMVRDELKAIVRADISAEITLRAWKRMNITGDTSLQAFQTFLLNAQKVGFLRDTPDLARFIETP